MSQDRMPQVPQEPILPVLSHRPTGGKRGPLGILGFLTGFALSAVIGAVLYIFLTAG